MISFLQWNINGYYNNYHELQLLIQSLSPSIILLNETHLAYNINPVHPKRYIGIFHNLTNITTSKQGVAILIKRGLPFKRIAIETTISAIAIEVELNVKLNIICCYCPPSQNVSVTDILHLIQQVPSPVILAGDLNGWSPIWGSPTTNTRGNIIENALLASELICLNDGNATHFSTHSTWSHIDLTLCSASLAPNCTWNLTSDLHGSDHYPIICKVNTQHPCSKFKPKSIFKTDLADWPKFSDLCHSTNTRYPVSTNTNTEAARIQKIIRYAANLSIPHTNNKKTSYNVPWWNTNLQSLRTNKQLAWRTYKRCQTTANLVAYKRLNALFRRTAKVAKRQSFQLFTANISPCCSPQKIWNDINILGGGSKNTIISRINTSEGSLTTPNQISNHFANHFSNASADEKFTSQFRNYKESILGTTELVYNLPLSAKMIEAEITLSEFEFALTSVKEKTPGLDKVSYPLIKNLPNSIKTRLIELYNTIFNTAVYPQSWKTAKIIPILKPNKPPDEVNSYRPTFLLSCLGKVLEKIIGNRLAWYAKRNNLISPRQFAYKKSHGTLDALLCFDNFVANALSNKNHVSVLSLDFQKAFDHIGIHIVLRQLMRWKVGPKIFNFVKSFLTNRKLTVSVNGFISTTRNLSNGTPQGSPLSALLFIIAFDELNHLLSKHKNIEHQIYADDALVYSKANDTSSVQNMFINVLNDISTWSLTSGVSLSIEKTNLLHICRKKTQCNISLNFDNDTLLPKDNLMILGLNVDSKYYFKPHCEYIRSSLASRLNIIKYLSSKHSYIHPTILINAVRALLLSKIDYALPIYGHCAKSVIRKLSAPYHAAIRRSIRAFPTSPIKFLLVESGLPSIESRINDATSRILAKQLEATNSTLENIFKKVIARKTQMRIPSAIFRSLEYAKENLFTLYREKKAIETFPPWLISPISFEDALIGLSKQNTPSAVYQAIFAQTLETYSTSGWNFIFTDGSKTSDGTSLAVVKKNGEVIRQWLLYPMCTIFSAESLAIKHAIDFANKSKGKFIICSDSKACITSIKSPCRSNKTISSIRNSLIAARNKIKLMWVPGHAGISGNELADAAAKNAIKSPTLTLNHLNKTDLYNGVKNTRRICDLSDWATRDHIYYTLNPKRLTPTYPANLSSNILRPYIRLRLGHTIFSHSHLITRRSPSCCPLCGGTNTVDHLLYRCMNTTELECTDSINLVTALSTPNYSNIMLIYNYLKDKNILNSI